MQTDSDVSNWRHAIQDAEKGREKKDTGGCVQNMEGDYDQMGRGQQDFYVGQWSTESMC